MSNTRAKSILIADDDPSSVILADAALTDAGYRVRIADGGAEAIRQFELERPDCLVLDVMMPGVSGYDVCRAIRARPDGRLLPILMLTSLNDHSSISESYGSGASDFAQKGLHPRLLVERVRFLLRDRGLQDELLVSRSRLELAQRIARIGHWELTAEGASINVSPVVGEMLGVPVKTIARYEDLLALLPAHERAATLAAFHACARGAGGFARDHQLRGPDGTPVFIHQEAQLVQPTAAGQAGLVLVTLQDITRLQRAEDALRTLTYTDAATSLPNRRCFAEAVGKALDEHSDRSVVAVIAIRLQGLDRAVAAHGEGFGNALLMMVADRIKQALGRSITSGAGESSTPAVLVARIAGDELGILLYGNLAADRLAATMAPVMNEISRPRECLAIEYVPVASAGIAVGQHDGSDADDLISHAHIAANQAADVGGCTFYSVQLQSQSRRRLSIESELRLAVERDQLHLVYQPRINIDALALVSVESLLRWEHPRLGSISPTEFIPIAEELGMIDDIGQWALDRACCQLAAWRAALPQKFAVAVNVSPRQLARPGLDSKVHAALTLHGLPADSLELEITESSLVAAGEESRAQLDALRATGVKIALDDFGTGYSSLGQIRRLPVDCLKLDGSLIADLRVDRGAQGMVAAVFAMARALGIRACAEGVQDGETLRTLKDLGCHEVQGYYVSRALSAEAFVEWLASGGPQAVGRSAAEARDAESRAAAPPR